MDFSLDAVLAHPDAAASGAAGHDAADRLILDESASARRGVDAGAIAVIGDESGALALAAAHDAGGGGAVRVHQDLLTGELALGHNAARVGLVGRTLSLPLDAELVRGARVVLARLPRSLDALRDIAGVVAAYAAPDVVVFAGGRIKHMTPAMNDVLREVFGRVDVTHARQKSRVLVAREPHGGGDPVPAASVVDGVEVRAFGGVFAGAALDIGTRVLLVHAPALAPGTRVVDLACGNGVVAATLALRYPELQVYASDVSAAAVASTRATAAANGVADRVEVARDDALSRLADDSVDVVLLNPPFHRGAAIDERIARDLFADAARVLRSGGELWAVWNSALAYRPALARLVGPTRQIARTPKFTLTASVAR
ncbi:methyltransferase [Microbacterium sp. 10M-3C3]|uniref:class I SAM-dependent methyltransferase n=1 Tax=Microbacterium sp. 10M-3C3 TaxID=2483401 RepID=UPI000F6418E7|nr:methyltransferase [Microbacterium sp. 10M-3C3]